MKIFSMLFCLVMLVICGCGGGDGVSSTLGTVFSTGAPTGVTASTSDTSVNLTWNPVTGATSYNIYWGTSSGVSRSSTKIPNISGITYQQTGLTIGTTYYYVVSANLASGESNLSSQVFITITQTTIPQTTGVVTTLAGAPVTVGATDATGAAARFSSPIGVTSDGTNLFVADSANHTIRQIVIASGVVTTLAGAPGVSGSANGIGGAARFNTPIGITTDGTNLYVADKVNSTNSTIRKILIATGEVTTPTLFGSAAGFSNFIGITMVGANDLYVADAGNNTIKRIVIATGEVTTPTLSGTTASFSSPIAITNDGINLYVVDQLNNAIKQIVIASGAVTTLAGSGDQGSLNGTGTAASFNFPTGITIIGTNLFVVDQGNDTIRQIVIAGGAVTTLAGTAGNVGFANATGAAASFSAPTGITTDGTKLFVTDTGNNTIRMIDLL